MEERLDGGRSHKPMPRFSKRLWDLKRFVDSVNFEHFLALTDETGMLQHSKFDIPDRRFGYTSDDNARALVVVARQFNSQRDKRWVSLAGRFLAFFVGMQIPDGRLHNFMSYAHEVEDDLDSGLSLISCPWRQDLRLRH